MRATIIAIVTALSATACDSPGGGTTPEDVTARDTAGAEATDTSAEPMVGRDWCLAARSGICISMATDCGPVRLDLDDCTRDNPLTDCADGSTHVTTTDWAPCVDAYVGCPVTAEQQVELWDTCVAVAYPDGDGPPMPGSE